jgi:hypothetical protein
MNRLSPQLVVVVATVVASGLVLPEVVTPARIPLLLVFAVAIPGLGWAWRLRLPDTGDALLLAITISVCLLVVVGEGMALLRVWSVKGAFLVLAAIAVLGVAPLHLFVRVAEQSMILLRVGRTHTDGAVVRRDPASWWPPVLLSWIGVLVLALVVHEAPTALRAPLVIGYVLMVPGLACVRLVRLPNRLAELALAVGLSLALAVVVAQAMIYLHVWSPVLGIAMLVIIASLATCAELLTVHWPQRTVTPPDGGESG